MKILFLTNNNNTIGLQNWLKDQKHSVVVYSLEISNSLIDKIKPDLVISYNYKYIITPDIIEKMEGNIVNLHISYLPWNKGSNPNIWSILENTPTGVTIHYVDEHLDTGKIIIQKKVEIDDFDTLRSSYKKLQDEVQNLFKIIFKEYGLWRMKAVECNENGTYHKMSDFEDIKMLITSWDMKVIKLKEKYKQWKNLK